MLNERHRSQKKACFRDTENESTEPNYLRGNRNAKWIILRPDYIWNLYNLTASSKANDKKEARPMKVIKVNFHGM
jgi:hypothetical protein